MTRETIPTAFPVPRKSTLVFPFGPVELPQPTKTELLDSAHDWLELMHAALVSGDVAEFWRCDGFFRRTVAEAKRAK